MSLAHEIKCRCASAYSSETARFLLGDGFHPGGAQLTDQLLGALDLGPAATVVDVACGPGVTTAAAARRSRAIGIDLSGENLAEARRRAARDGSAERARFVRGDAEALPLRDASADAIVCECALCTFPDQRAAARELVRVLRPGGPPRPRRPRGRAGGAARPASHARRARRLRRGGAAARRPGRPSL